MKRILFTALLLFAATASADFDSETAPYQDFGVIRGFKMMAKHPTGTQLTKVGVQKGDAVIAVNGRSIASVEDARRAYGENDVKVVHVYRNNRPVRLKARGK